MSHRLNLDKFIERLPMPNKREAMRPLMKMVEDRAGQSPRSFSALTMPSPTMYDVNALYRVGVRKKNISIIENNKECFDIIRSRTTGDMTDAPLELGQRVWLEDKKYNWINFDMCGPLHQRLLHAIFYVLKSCIQPPSILFVTVKCARERYPQKHMMEEFCRIVHHTVGLQPAGLSLQHRREFTLFASMCIAPREYGLFPDFYQVVKYREDRYRHVDGEEIHQNGSTMMCAAACYRKLRKTDSVQKLWENICEKSAT